LPDAASLLRIQQTIAIDNLVVFICKVGELNFAVAFFLHEDNQFLRFVKKKGR
jgi:hypothetical protein